MNAFIPFLTFLAALNCSSVFALKAQALTRPNILMIVADDLGVQDIRAKKQEDFITPHIAALAKTGVEFSRHYTAGDVCAPSRASILTGLYPQRLQYRIGHRGLSEEIPTVADVFRENGYSTHHVGKWHLGHEFYGTQLLDQGYDSFFGFFISGHLKGDADDNNPLGLGDTYINPYLVVDQQRPKQFKGHLTELLTEEAANVIATNSKDTPWFLSVWYFAPHAPLEAPEKWLQKYDGDPRRRYKGLLSVLDEGVERLLHTLRETGQASNTIVVFLSDNGAVDQRSNLPYIGITNSFREEGVRTPLFFVWPDRLKPARIEHVVSSLDIYPTLISLAGLHVPGRTDGKDLSLLMANNAIAPRPLFWEAYEVSNAGIQDEGLSFDFAILDSTGQWRLVSENGDLSLFDLKQDPTGSMDVKRGNE